MYTQKSSDMSKVIENNEMVGLRFNYFSKKNNAFISSLVKKTLQRMDMVFLHDTLMTVLRELIVNAVKANSKRYYFSVNKLDITNADHYRSAMRSFKGFIVNEGENISGKLRESNLQIELYFKKINEGLKIYVRNNTPILSSELSRIQKRITEAKTYSDFSEVYGGVMDDSEGEGLGLLLTVLFLRNSGIGENSLTIASDGKITQATVTIPNALKPQTITNEIQGKILSDVNDLPSFPAHVNEILELCDSPEAQVKIIADKILSDPSLSASVLKLSNSAGFARAKKIDNINDALIVIGMRNLKALLAACSTKIILENKYAEYKKIWEHCTRAAFYAREIAEKKGYAKISDRAFLGGILHDLGKIILLSSSKKLNDWIAEITSKRDIKTTTVLEELSIGISHSTIGGLISEKWNMPDYITEAIRFHHAPYNASAQNSALVAITYLANELCEVERGKYDYTHIESDVLDMFNLHDEKLLTEFHDAVRLSYEGVAV